jgi:hypothetical protein
MCKSKERTEKMRWSTSQFRLLMNHILSVVAVVCSSFQKLPPQKTSADFQLRHATKLYDTYIRYGSPDEIALSPTVVIDIVRRLCSAPNPLLFNEAQLEVEEAMRDESYNRFLNHELCGELKKHVAHVNPCIQGTEMDNCADAESRLQQLRKNEHQSLSPPLSPVAAGGTRMHMQQPAPTSPPRRRKMKSRWKPVPVLRTGCLRLVVLFYFQSRW